MQDDGAERVIERLIEALAAQVAAGYGLAPGAVEALSDLSRSDAGWIYGVAGHLVHYGVDTEPLQELIQLIADFQRSATRPDAPIMPGDEVRLVGELPAHLATYDAGWLRETVFVVRYVGGDGSIDVQPALTEDYVIETLPNGSVELVYRSQRLTGGAPPSH